MDGHVFFVLESLVFFAIIRGRVFRCLENAVTESAVSVDIYWANYNTFCYSLTWEEEILKVITHRIAVFHQWSIDIKASISLCTPYFLIVCGGSPKPSIYMLLLCPHTQPQIVHPCDWQSRQSCIAFTLEGFLLIQSDLFNNSKTICHFVFSRQVLGFEVDSINSVQFSNHTGEI